MYVYIYVLLFHLLQDSQGPRQPFCWPATKGNIGMMEDMETLDRLTRHGTTSPTGAFRDSSAKGPRYAVSCPKMGERSPWARPDAAQVVSK